MKRVPHTSRREFVAGSLLSVGAMALSASGCDTERPSAVVSRPELTRPLGPDDGAWAHVRAQFILEPGVAYMNNASLGMPPGVVVEAVANGYEAISREPLHGKHALQDDIAARVVPGLAKLLGVEADEVALTRNATEALHLQAVGLDLEPGDEVIFTTQEHPAGLRPWQFRAERHGITATDIFVPSPLESHDHVVDLFERAITPRTRAIAFCHVTRGGHRYPVKRLAEMARSHGLLSLVDGAQALGQFPIDLHDLRCDAYSASLHKWLLGPVGTGVLYVRRDARSRIRSSFAHDATLDVPALAPPGTADFPLRAGLAAALEFVETIGLDNVAARTRYLSDYLKDRLARVDGVTLLSGSTSQTSCPGSTIFELAGVDAMALVPVMDERHSIHLDEHQRDGHNAIRISTHIYNTTSEIDRLVAALESLS